MGSVLLPVKYRRQALHMHRFHVSHHRANLIGGVGHVSRPRLLRPRWQRWSWTWPPCFNSNSQRYSMVSVASFFSLTSCWLTPQSSQSYNCCATSPSLCVTRRRVSLSPSMNHHGSQKQNQPGRSRDNYDFAQTYEQLMLYSLFRLCRAFCGLVFSSERRFCLQPSLSRTSALSVQQKAMLCPMKPRLIVCFGYSICSSLCHHLTYCVLFFVNKMTFHSNYISVTAHCNF